MSREIENIVIIDRFDYDELVEKSGATEQEIAKQAEALYMSKNLIPLKVEFSNYRNFKNFSVPIFIARSNNIKKNIREELDKIEPHIQEWMKENLRMFTRELIDKGLAEQDCIDMKKQIEDLGLKIKGLKIKYTYSVCSLAVSLVALAFLLYSLYVL